MGVNTMEIIVYTQKALKTCYRSACEHPSMVGVLLFFIFLYRFLPFLFFLLLSSSPVIICTAVLLGTLLSFGSPYLPEIDEQEQEHEEEKPHHEISFVKTSGGVGNELVFDKDENFSVETYVNESRDAGENDLIFSEKTHREEDDGYISSSTDGVEELAKEIHGEKGVVDEEKPLIEGENDGVVQYSKLRVKEIGGIEGVDDFGEVQYSPISKGGEDNEESSDYDSDSDRAESSSPDASLAEIIPMLDELHPLLDSELPQAAVVSVEDDDVVSDESITSSDESEEEEVENAEIEDDKEEKQGGKDDGTEAVVTWTEEDEKNLMDLGNSELERNRRLESLIARRRARKSFRMTVTEKNLIDLDGFELPFQMAPISTARRNPFDLHYDSNEGMDLPLIPGSAPSVLAPRRNPFDIPYDPNEERPNLAGGSFVEEFMSSHEKDMHFRRYESFSVGSSSFGETKQGKPASKFRPYFVPEQVLSEGISYATFERQLSEISESKMSSVTEIESVSSASDQDNQKSIAEQESSHPMPLVEQELSQQMPPVERAPEPVILENSSSEEVDFVKIDQEYHRDTVADEENVDERESTSLEMEPITSPMGSETTDVSVKPEVVEEKHTELSSSSSSEVNEMLFHVNSNEGVEIPEQKTNDSAVNNFTQQSVEDSNLGNGVKEVDDSQTKEPVYDWNWNPSEVEKTLSGITIIEEALNYVDKRVLTSTSSAVSDMPVEALEVGSAQGQVERTISSMDEEPPMPHGDIEEETTVSNEGPRAASSHLHAVEENEFNSREVTMISEHDVIEVGFSGDNQNDDNVTAPMAPSVTEQVVYDSGSSSSGTEFEDKSSGSKEANVQREQNQVHVSSSSLHPVHIDVPLSNVDAAGSMTLGVSSEDSVDIMSKMSPPMLQKPVVRSSSGADQEESQEPSSTPVDEGDVIDESYEVIHGDRSKDYLTASASVSSPALILSEISAHEPATYEINFEDDRGEIENSRYSEDLEHYVSPLATGFELTDMEFNVVEEITEIDEDFLIELDAVGDFGVEELETNKHQTESLVAVEETESLTGLQALEADSAKDFKDDSHKNGDSLTDMQDLETRFVEVVHLTPTQILVNEMEDQLKITESEDGSGEISAKLLDSAIEAKSDSQELMAKKPRTGVEESNYEAEETCKTLSSSNTGESNNKTEADEVGDISVEVTETNTNQTENILVREVEESLVGLHVCEDSSSKDVEESSLKSQDSMEALADLQDLEARLEEEVHLTPKQLVINKMEDQLEPNESEGGSGENSAGVLESAIYAKSDPEDFVAEEARESVKHSTSEAEDAYEDSSPSRANESEKKTGLHAVGAVSVEETETTVSKDIGVQSSLTGSHILEDWSSKDIEDDSHKSKESMDPRLEGEVHSIQKHFLKDQVEDLLKPTESEDGSGEISVKVKESSIEVKSNSEVLTEETKTDVKESNSEVEDTYEASSSSTTVVKKKEKGSSKSSSSSSTSSSSSSSDSD